MSKALEKASRLKKPQQANLLSALRNGGPLVWLSCLIMGFGNMMAGQIIKGLLLLAVEAAFVVFMLLPQGGAYYLSMLPSLGWKPMTEVYNEDLGIYEYVPGHNSQVILLYGVACVFIIIAFLLAWQYSVRSGYKALSLRRAGKKPNTILQDLKSLTDENTHKLFMSPPTLCLVIFTILPIVYMMCMAFTNYSKEGDHLILFDWVGFKNFGALFNKNSSIGSQFGSVLGWTLIWAIFATVSNFICGTIVALIINKKGIRLKGLWRTCLSMTIAIPQFVSLMVIRSMLQPDGIINRMMLNAGLITERLPFLTNATWARVLVLVVNLWVGIPYTIMQVTGILKNIPAEQYEAATIDGAGHVSILFHVMAPLSKAGIATLTMFYGVVRWNEYYRSGIYISSISEVPLQVILRKFVVDGDVTTLIGTQNLMDYNALAQLDYTALQYATIVVATVPILLVYPLVLKYYNKDVMAGGVKE